MPKQMKGIYYGQAVNPSISASYNPQIFGMFTFTNPDARLQAIRHVIKPSVSFSYIPSLPGLSSDMYETVQTRQCRQQDTGIIQFMREIFLELLHYQRRAECFIRAC